MIRVLVVDDHPLFRQGVVAAVTGSPHMCVAGEASNTDEAVEAAARERPDVVLLDIAMPGGGGIEALRRIRAANAAARVVMLTMSDDEDAVFAALRAGARGYLLKDSSKETIRDAIVSVARGEAVFGPGAAERVVSFFVAARPALIEAFPQLTPRERELLDLIAAGLDNRSIARRLTLSEKTVRNNVSSILTKLRVATRAEAIVAAREAGLGTAR